MKELARTQAIEIKRLEDALDKAWDRCWENFYINQEVFSYLLEKGYVKDVVDEDTWESAAVNIINAIKNIESKLPNKA